MREEEAAEPALTPKARGPSLPKPWPSAGLPYRSNGGVGAVTASEGQKEEARDLKDLVPDIIARAAEHLRYVFGF